MKKTVIIGVGNILLGDDGIGNHVAQLIRNILPPTSSVDIKEVSAGGIELIEEMIGYERAIVIDAVSTRKRIGTIHKLKPEQFECTVHFTAPHCFNFASAYQLGKRFAPESMPKTVTIYGIEIEPRREFSEKLSAEVSTVAQRLATEIVEDLMRLDRK